MTWIDELRDKMRRLQAEEQDDIPPVEMGGDGDQQVVYVRRLVRSLLDQMNHELLEDRGSVWEVQPRWGVWLWEMWWGRTRREGQYLVVTLLRDSRGLLYLKVNRERLALQDPLLERRLQRALQAAFLRPRSYVPSRSEGRADAGPAVADAR